MTYVVPHVGSGLIIGGELESPLQAADGHVILLRVETAETEVSKQFCVIHTNLKEPSGGGREEKGKSWKQGKRVCIYIFSEICSPPNI